MSHAQIVSIGNRAIELLSNNIVPWINDPENGRDLSLRAYNARTHRKYNILNTLMLGRAGAWLTKTHIFDLNRELGLIDDPEHRISFAGVKPHSVLMWFKPRRDERNENDQQDTTEEEQDENVRWYSMFQYVWHIDELSNVPQHIRDRLTRTVPEFEDGVRRRLNRWLREHGVSYNHTQNGVSYYNPQTRNISLGATTADLAHETFHAVLHLQGLYEYSEVALACRGESTSVDELACEIATGVLLAQTATWTMTVNCDMQEYCRTWADALRRDPAMYYHACVLANKAMKFILPEVYETTEVVETAQPEQNTVAENTCAICGSVFYSDMPATVHGRKVCSDCLVRYTNRPLHHFETGVRHIGKHIPLFKHGETCHTLGMELEHTINPDDLGSVDHDGAVQNIHMLNRMIDPASNHDESVFMCVTDASINLNGYGGRPDCMYSSGFTASPYEAQNYYGIEVVSQPSTLDWWMSNDAIDMLCDTMKSYGFVGHDTVHSNGTPICGLHVHIGREWLTDGFRYTGESAENTVCAKLVALYDTLGHERYRTTRDSKYKGWSTIERFARRRFSEDYCQMNDAGITPEDSAASASRKAESTSRQRVRDNSGYPSDRYKVVNLTNTRTVEIRVFRGTTSKDTVKATLQFVHNTVEYARSHSITECCAVSIEDVINYIHHDELDAYARKCHLIH